MPGKLTRKDIARAIAAERRMLAELVEGLSAAQWGTESACAGWTVGEVVNHLMVADRFPTKAGWGILLAPLRRQSPRSYLSQWQRAEAARGPAHAARELRSGTLSFTARFFGRLGALGNFLEVVVHIEDVRRTLDVPRPPGTPPEEIVWASLRLATRYQVRKLGARGRLAFETPSQGSFTVTAGRFWSGVRDGSEYAAARVRGDPLELLLFLTGRKAEVSIEGRGPMADAVRSTPMRF